MSTQHTPGPWLADLEVYPVVVRSQSETWPLVDEIGNEEGRAGAFVCNTGDNKANARLIAAAPDLLEALQQIVEQHGQWNNGIWAANIARAAISKATGGAK